MLLLPLSFLPLFTLANWNRFFRVLSTLSNESCDSDRLQHLPNFDFFRFGLPCTFLASHGQSMPRRRKEQPLVVPQFSLLLFLLISAFLSIADLIHQRFEGSEPVFFPTTGPTQVLYRSSSIVDTDLSHCLRNYHCSSLCIVYS